MLYCVFTEYYRKSISRYSKQEGITSVIKIDFLSKKPNFANTEHKTLSFVWLSNLTNPYSFETPVHCARTSCFTTLCQIVLVSALPKQGNCEASTYIGYTYS